ncbi:MAG: hypothetical protein LBG10_07630 [Treponema sp.]|jgi:hypothetical protein|nr:hypothetical protein [Treponema sp.]
MREKIPEKSGALVYGVFLAALVFSVVFIALHADHDCSPGEYCPVCVQLCAAMNLLKHCGSVPARLFGGFGFFAAAELLKSFFPSLTQPTSVSLKIRMNT